MKTHLFFGLLTVVLLVIVIGSRRQEAFVFEDVIDMAQAIAPGIDFANRFHIWMGVMAYLGSPIWLLFLMAGAVDLAFQIQVLAFVGATGK